MMAVIVGRNLSCMWCQSIYGAVLKLLTIEYEVTRAHPVLTMLYRVAEPAVSVCHVVWFPNQLYLNLQYFK